MSTTVLQSTEASLAIRCLQEARDLLSHPELWDRTGVGPGWCPLRAVARAVNLSDARFRWLLKVRLAFRLAAALPGSHRSWCRWPESNIRYNADPNVSHADILAWLDRAIAGERG